MGSTQLARSGSSSVTDNRMPNAFALLSVGDRFPPVPDSAITVAVLTGEWKTVCEIKRNNAGRSEELLPRKPPIEPTMPEVSSDEGNEAAVIYFDHLGGDQISKRIAACPNGHELAQFVEKATRRGLRDQRLVSREREEEE
jgi:hypothetical protein